MPAESDPVDSSEPLSRGEFTGALRRYRGDGTLDIVGGSVVAGIAALAYEVVGGRVLGVAGFAPIGALLTLHFVVFLVVLVPLEQVTIRRLTLDPDRPGIPVGAISVIGCAAAVAGLVGWVFRSRLFAGDPAFAFLVAATVVTHGGFALARGYLAGRSRYRSYGLASGAASLLRLAVAGVVAAMTTSGWLFGLALVVGPVVVAAWRPFGRSVDAPEAGRATVVDVGSSEGHMVFGLVLASAAAQAMLLVGPVVAALLGADAATVSIVFVTFSLLRAPLSIGYNLVARLVPPLTVIAERGDHTRLARIAIRVGFASAITAAAGAAFGYAIGPWLIGSVFGAEFRPDPWFVALVAGGVVLAAGALAVGQVFVARGDTGRLADAWLGGTVVAGAVLLLPLRDPAISVAVAFLAGETAAVLLLLRQARTIPDASSHRLRSRRYGYAAAKRVIDVTVASALLILAAPLMLVVALAIVMRSGRPVLHRQIRVGRGGVPFTLWKFRTMPVDADPTVFWEHIRELAAAAEAGSEDQPDLRIHDDPRLTPIGKVLRSTSLDELPNLWNVVRGEMSLVGPRPLLPVEVTLIRTQLGDFAAARRADVLPGVTGLAQVGGRDDISMQERSDLDLTYVAQRSLSLDMWILARTAVGIVRHRGR